MDWTAFRMFFGIPMGYGNSVSAPKRCLNGTRGARRYFASVNWLTSL
jgi:hypothetical protein